MKWNVVNPRYGDMIRVKAGNIFHYGIYVNDDEVIQFGESPIVNLKPAKDITIISSNIDAFLQNEFLEVAIYTKKEKKLKYAPKIIVKNAKSRIGEKGYDLLKNNCEHFVYECVFGIHKSEQSEKIFNPFLKPIVDVYYAFLAKKINLSTIYPVERISEIENCTNEKVQLEKYSVWKLLSYAFKKSFKQKIKKINFYKNWNGKWLCDYYYFSLSHTDNIVAVAVSNYPIGIDIELIKQYPFEIIKKALSDDELLEFDCLNQNEKIDFFIKKWTQKESVYKINGEEVFNPRIINNFKGISNKIIINKQSFYMSIASDKIKYINIFRDVRIK